MYNLLIAGLGFLLLERRERKLVLLATVLLPNAIKIEILTIKTLLNSRFHNFLKFFTSSSFSDLTRRKNNKGVDRGVVTPKVSKMHGKNKMPVGIGNQASSSFSPLSGLAVVSPRMHGNKSKPTGKGIAAPESSKIHGKKNMPVGIRKGASSSFSSLAGLVDGQGNQIDIKKLMKDVEFLGSSKMTWKERKDLENRKVVSLGGKPPKQHRTPLSVARVTMKKKKEKEEKMLQEGLVLGNVGERSGSKVTERRKREDRVLMLSQGHFSKGVLDVKHLLKQDKYGGDSGGGSRDVGGGGGGGGGGKKRKGGKHKGKKKGNNGGKKRR